MQYSEETDAIAAVPEKQGASAWRRLGAWCVHGYTALGLLAAMAITFLIFQGDGNAFRWSFGLMIIATLIDATDGTLARLVDVKRATPGFDGRRLDDLIDFLNYTCLPLLIIWRLKMITGSSEWLLLVPLFASAYGFCQTSAKTEDGYFLGFPSYWNVVAFYAYVLRPPSEVAVVGIIVLSILTFVPARYLYPTQPGRLNQLTSILGMSWGLLVAWILFRMPPDYPLPTPEASRVRTMSLLSLAFPVYYLLVSWSITWRIWRNASK
jgi:phosphatidylcholine synthase